MGDIGDQLKSLVPGPKTLAIIVTLGLVVLIAAVVVVLVIGMSFVKAFEDDDARRAAPENITMGDQVVTTGSVMVWANGSKVGVNEGVSGTVIDGPDRRDNKVWYKVYVKTRRGSTQFWSPQYALNVTKHQQPSEANVTIQTQTPAKRGTPAAN
jgi:hypothetical protein